MEHLRMSRWVEGGRRVLRLLGSFDAPAARELLGRIREASEREIVIDVGLVRDLDEVGVAALARLVHGHDARRIALRGLSVHQLRILRHLGAGLSRVAVGDGR